MKKSELVPYLEKCAETCYACSEHLKTGNDEIDSSHSVVAIDCADMCSLTAKMITRHSDFSKIMIKACVELCDACDEACSAKNTIECKNCAEACRNCADECLKYISIHMP